MRLEKEVLGLVEDEVASDLNIVEDRSFTIEDHVPSIIDCNVGSSLRKNLIRPVFHI